MNNFYRERSLDSAQPQTQFARRKSKDRRIVGKRGTNGWNGGSCVSDYLRGSWRVWAGAEAVSEGRDLLRKNHDWEAGGWWRATECTPKETSRKRSSFSSCRRNWSLYVCSVGSSSCKACELHYIDRSSVAWTLSHYYWCLSSPCENGALCHSNWDRVFAVVIYIQLHGNYHRFPIWFHREP